MDEKDTDAELDLYIAMQMTLQDKIQEWTEQVTNINGYVWINATRITF